MPLPNHCLLGFFLFFCMTCFSCGPHAKELLVYTAIEPEWISKYVVPFEAQHPGVKINLVRSSAGAIAARMLAERNNPKADVVIGLSAIAMEGLRKENLLLPYSPKGAEDLNVKMVHPDKYWFGITAWGGSICVNTQLLERDGLPVPQSWEDLTKPIYKGRIVMPSPLASSTGYMFLLGWIQSMGEERAWEYVKALNENMLFYSFSGARPAAMVAQGEVAIGLSSEAFLAPFKRYNVPVITVEPIEGIPWDCEASALPKGSPNMALAKEYLDFCASGNLAQTVVGFSGIVSREKLSSDSGQRLVKAFMPMNFSRAGAEKKRLIQQWQTIISQ